MGGGGQLIGDDERSHQLQDQDSFYIVSRSKTVNRKHKLMIMLSSEKAGKSHINNYAFSKTPKTRW